jgi:hypothetical protein
MRRPGGALLVVLALLAGVAPTVAAETAPGAAADRPLLEQIIAEEEIATSEEPSFGEYARSLSVRLQWGVVRATGALGAPLMLLLLVVVVLVLLLAAVLAGLQLARRWRRPAATGDDDGAPPDVAPLPEQPDLAARLEQELAAGRAREALRTLWLWLAAALGQRQLLERGETLTNREVVGAVRRSSPDWPGLSTLRQLALASERLMYGGEPVDVERVRALRRDAERVVA